MDIELRGYEVCRLDGGRAVKVGTYQPTNLGLDEACKTAARMNERHPSADYVVRALISIPPPRPEAPQDDTQLPLPGVP
jgi:hypothetical protein